MIKLTKSWYDLLKCEFEKDYFKNLQEFLNEEYSNYTVFPSVEKIFSALNYVKYDDVKVVIVGQDPYHEEGQAQGLAFSVPSSIKTPPSLVNIYKELKSDLGIEKGSSGDLTDWAKQGVLLLNTVLTVRKGMANSHKGKGWERLTTEIIKLLNKREKPIVFVLWGNNAKAFETLINKEKHLVLKSAHPSPLSAYNGFFGCKHFSKINTFLEEKKLGKINW